MAIERNNSGYGFRRNYELYLFLLPGFMFIFLFDILPMVNITIAFKNFRPLLGLKGSPWIGFQNFKRLLSDPQIWKIIRNTLEINFLKTFFCIPLPMFLAILINEMIYQTLKKSVQTIIYIPHFFTWVVVYSIFYIMFGSGGIINTVITKFIDRPIIFFINGNWMRFLLIISDAWHSTGWGTIVYLAAIMGIDSELFDAATVDGAGRWQRIWHITIPCLMPVLVLMTSIRLGNIMRASFDQVLAFYNPSVYENVDIIGTYVYRTGIGQANFSYATAVGLFNSVIGLIMIILANIMSRRVTGRSIW